MGVVFLITTFNRQESCQRLVDSLQGKGDIIVLIDGSDYDISGAMVIRHAHNYGRERYWETVNQLFSRRGHYKYFFMLPDDFLPADNMVEKAINIWNNIRDNKKVCLNLYADRIGLKCWTGYAPKDIGEVYLTQWMDMCIMCENEFFNALGRVRLIKFNKFCSPRRSSGVGAQISRTLFYKKYNLYQVKESLVIPQPEHFIKSQMKPNQ